MGNDHDILRHLPWKLRQADHELVFAEHRDAGEGSPATSAEMGR